MSLVQMRAADLGASGRSCGDCRLCCRVLGVKELEKPKGEWCKHACSKGCAIYDERPPSCRDFACLWLWGFPGLLEEDRPDRVRLVVWHTGSDSGPQLARHNPTRDVFPVIQVHEGHAGAALSKRGLALLDRLLRDGWAVSVCDDQRVRSLYFPNGDVDHFLAGDPRADFGDHPSPSALEEVL